MKCFIAFRLAPGVTYEQYLAWFQQRNARAVARFA